MAWHTLDGLSSAVAWRVVSDVAAEVGTRSWLVFRRHGTLVQAEFLLAPLGLLLAQARRVLRGEIGLLFVPALEESFFFSCVMLFNPPFTSLRPNEI